MTEVRLALPSKGRMEGETLDFLANCGLHVSKTNPRQYSARVPEMPNVLVLFQRARDLAKSVAAGDVDLAITGYDTVVDALGPEHEEIVLIHEALGYGECSLVLAVPNAWNHVNNIAELGDYASQMGELRVASKHTNATRLFLQKHQLSDIHVISADGALEAAPTIGYADLIADITSTGTTLRENQLKRLEGGTIVDSQAVFIGSRQALMERQDVRDITVQILEYAEAHLRGKRQYLIFANIRGESPEEIRDRIFTNTDIGGLQGPTVSQVLNPRADDGWWAINIVVSASKLYNAIQQIRSIGGSGVVATPVSYIFEERPERVTRLFDTLNLSEAT